MSAKAWLEKRGKDPDHDLDSWSEHDIDTPQVEHLLDDWMEAKEDERKAVDLRRRIENQLVRTFNISEDEGSRTITDKGYKVKVTQRFNRTIDADLLQEIAAEHGITQHLADLFRWKPDINAKAWKDAAGSITGPLMQAITTKPGRPSFSIEREAQEQ